MNNEPVAWMHKIATSWVTTIPDDAENEWIPLYTHPSDLTDEEILEIGREMFESPRWPSTALDFARAILRKASEK